VAIKNRDRVALYCLSLALAVYLSKVGAFDRAKKHFRFSDIFYIVHPKGMRFSSFIKETRYCKTTSSVTT